MHILIHIAVWTLGTLLVKPLDVHCVLDMFSIFTSADKALLDFEVSREDGGILSREANAPPRSPVY